MATNSSIKIYVQKTNANKTLTVGYDDSGRLISCIRNGEDVLAKDLFINLPHPEFLEKQGWMLKH